MKKLNLVLMVGLLTGALSAQAQQLENLKGVLVLGKGIVFQVVSGGCTGKDSFKIKVLESKPAQVALVRVEEDLCEANLPNGELVRYSWKEIGLKPGTPFKLRNRVNPDARFVRE